MQSKGPSRRLPMNKPGRLFSNNSSRSPRTTTTRSRLGVAADRDKRVAVFGKRSCSPFQPCYGNEPSAMRTGFLQMKHFFSVVALAAPLAAAVAFAQGNKLDLATLTCQKLFEMKRDQVNLVLAWLQAYYLEEDAPPVVDLDKLAADTLRLSGYCAANPQDDINSAADTLFGK